MNDYIELENVSLHIDKIPILDNISQKFEAGDMVLIIGPSGEGKTTMMEVFTGMRKPDAGKIKWSGKYLGQDIPYSKLGRERCRLMGLVFWDYRLSLHLSGWDNIYLPSKLSGIKIDKEKINEMVEVFFHYDISGRSKHHSIDELLSKKAGTMSGGEQERIALIRAFVLSPPIIFADELLRSVDPWLRNKIWEYVKKIHGQKNLCTIIISHNNDFIKDDSFTDRYLFKEGNLVEIQKGDLEVESV